MGTAAASLMEALPAPSVGAVRACRGDLPSIASLAWPDDAEPFSTLGADAVYALAEICLLRLADEEAEELVAICQLFGCLPERYLRLDDPVLGHEFNRRCLLALGDESQGTGESDDESRGGVRFTTGGPPE